MDNCIYVVDLVKGAWGDTLIKYESRSTPADFGGHAYAAIMSKQMECFYKATTRNTWSARCRSSQSINTNSNGVACCSANTSSPLDAEDTSNQLH